MAALVIFVLAIISPHLAGKIQKRSNQQANQLKRISDWLYDPLAWWARHTIEFIRRLIVKVAAWGRRARQKLPF